MVSSRSELRQMEKPQNDENIICLECQNVETLIIVVFQRRIKPQFGSPGRIILKLGHSKGGSDEDVQILTVAGSFSIIALVIPAAYQPNTDFVSHPLLSTRHHE